MFNDNNIRKILNTKKYNTKPYKIQIKKEVKKSYDSTNEKVFRTSENCDPLIWYYNILLNGMQSYHFLGNNAYQEENKIKMELVYKIRENWRDRLCAVNHVDNTGRLQTVSREENELYYDLIYRFGNLTGIPVLLNTSFNENEPVVCKPEEAVSCFLRTRMDFLVIGSFFCTRDNMVSH